ncbi:MAG: hypothetical protein JNL72_03020 [Flavipsychrobacter sp.]|nr:hypothetical protein [Flavipsychrobacter sp.]
MKKLFSILMVCISMHSFAQTSTQPASKTAPVATTINNLLSSSTLPIHNGQYEVTGFEISILPTRGDLIGPFKIRGKELDARAKEALSSQKGKSGKIFIDAIYAKNGNDPERMLPSVLFKYTN